MIPKVVHYVWLSGEEMPELNRKCVESWQRVLNGYELRRWSLADVEAFSLPFVSEAVREKKWAFATDCLRAEILLREGGIYLDSDVYLYKDFDGCLDNRFFSCIEFHHDSKAAAIQAACMGAEPGHPLMRSCAAYYRERHFVRPDGSPETQELAPDVYAAAVRSFGFDPSSPTEQHLREGIRIYDRSLVAGTPWEIAEDNVGVHMCAGSWRDMDGAEQKWYSALKLRMTVRP